MVRVVRDSKLSDRLRKFGSSPFFIPVILLLFLVVTIPVISLLSSKQTEIRQHAATSGLTATINASPDTGTVAPGQQFSVDLVIDGGGQPFNAAQATVAVSSNLTINSVVVTPVTSGGCNFTFANQNSTPKVSNPSFAGAILNSSSDKCTVYTLNLTASGTGIGTLSVSNSQVKSSVDNSEIFVSSKNGAYTIGTVTTPLPQSVLYLSPSTGSFTAGQDFSVQVRTNTNGQTINGMETQITYPSNLLDLVSVNNTGIDLDIVVPLTNTAGTVNLAYGSIVPKSGDLLISTLNFHAKAAGNVDMDFVNPSVVSDISNQNVLKNFTNGNYTITGVGATSTPIPPTPTTAVNPTSTPIPPTPTTAVNPTSTPIPPTPTITPTPTTAVNPTATPTQIPGLTINVNPVAAKTYQASITLSGTKSSNATLVFVNNSSGGVTYPSSTTWQSGQSLAIGNNPFALYSQDSGGNKSSVVTLSVARHRIGDINGDNAIDLTDLSIFGSDWEKVGNFNDVLSDMNTDGTINLTDFSIFAKAYGN